MDDNYYLILPSDKFDFGRMATIESELNPNDSRPIRAAILPSGAILVIINAGMGHDETRESLSPKDFHTTYNVTDGDLKDADEIVPPIDMSWKRAPAGYHVA